MAVAGLVLVLLQCAEALRAVGPVWPVPTDLWQPDYSTLPSNVNYVYYEALELPLGNYTYIQANSSLSVEWKECLLAVAVQGFETWTGLFEPMQGLTRLERGYYGNVTQYPDSATTTSGAMTWVQGTYLELQWGFEGWFTVDSVQYNGTSLTNIQLRFYYVTRYGSGQGVVRWSINDHSKPQGPITPPKNLWTAPKHALPTSGNYAYMESQWPGYNYTYTFSNSLINCSFNGNQTQIEVR